MTRRGRTYTIWQKSVVDFVGARLSLPSALPLLVVLSLVLILAAGIAAPLTPARAQDRDFSEVDAYLTALMAEYDIPGTSIALVESGSVVYTQGYGVRSTETADPVTADSLFCIGSVSKSVTAAGIALLVDQGKLDLDTPIVEYVPDFKLSDPDATAKLTLRHLLSQSSGLPGTDVQWYTGELADQQAVIEHIATLSLTAQPGEKYQYENYNYVIAAHVLEQVTGQPWADFLREQLFVPLDMPTAVFDVPSMQESADFAAPHSLDLRDGMQPIPFRETIDLIGPAGSINASAREMAQYTLFQLGDGTVNGQRLMSQALLDEMHTQQVAFPADDAQQSKTSFRSAGYSLGWVNGSFRGYPLVWHNGSIDGYYSFVILVPSRQIGITVLTNSQGPSEIMAQVSALALMQWMIEGTLDPELDDTANQEIGYDPAAQQALLDSARSYQPDPAALDRLIGPYTSAFAQISIASRDGTLVMDVDAGTGLQSLEIVPYEEDGFLIEGFVSRGYFNILTFTATDDGTVLLSLDGQRIAQRLAEGVSLATYTDPQNRFTATIPLGLTPQEDQPLAAFISADPEGVFVVAATDAAAENLAASAQAFVAQLHPDFELAAADRRDFQTPDGRTWTQYIYTLSEERLLVVLALREGSTDYFISLEAASSAIQTLAVPLQDLLLSFQISGS